VEPRRRGCLHGLHGRKDAWHGFGRYDFLMDEGVWPSCRHGRPGRERRRRCIVVAPSGRRPAIRGLASCYWTISPKRDRTAPAGISHRLYHRRLHLKPSKHWDACMRSSPSSTGCRRAGLHRMSRAASTRSPGHDSSDKVSCIYADNPGPTGGLRRLGDLAGTTCPAPDLRQHRSRLGKNALAIENIYQQFGGRISMMIRTDSAIIPQPVDPSRSRTSSRRAFRRSASSSHLRRRQVHEDILLRHGQFVPELCEGERVHRLSRAAVHRMLRPLRVRSPRCGRTDQRHRAEDRSPGSLDLPRGSVSREATVDQLSWPRASTSSPARYRSTPTAHPGALECGLPASDR